MLRGRLLATLFVSVVAATSNTAIRVVEVSVTDFGAVPGADDDSCLAFNRTIEAARARNASLLRIPQGTYHFHWDACVSALIYASNTVMTPLPPRNIALWLRDLSDIVVDGEGSVLSMHGLMTPIVVDHSSNVTVRNLTIDWPHPTVVEALVASSAPRAVDLVVHPAFDFTLTPHGGVVFDADEGWTLDGVHGLLSPASKSGGIGTLCQEYDPVADTTWRRRNPLAGATVVAVAGSPRTLRLIYPVDQEDVPAQGHGIWLRDAGRSDTGLLTQFSADVTYADVALHFMSSFGILSQFTRGALTFRNVTAQTAQSDSNGLACACAADLLHFSGCGGKITVEGGRFVGNQDDAVNIHGTHLRIVAQPSPRELVVQFMHSQSYGFQAFSPGDVVQFTRQDTLEAFGAGVVTAADMVFAQGCAADPSAMLPCQMHLLLEAPLDAEVRLGSDVVENLAYTATTLSITGAVFSRIPVHGICMTTRGAVVIANNTIHAHLSALIVADDASSWYESGPVTDVLFEGNVVPQAPLVSGGPYGAAVVLVVPTNIAPSTVHRNLRIVGNNVTFSPGSNTSLVGLKSIAGVVVEGNYLVAPQRPDAAALVTQVNCSDVVVQNNTIVG
jgi:hypothetical protein